MIIACIAYFSHEYVEMLQGTKDRLESHRMLNVEKYVLKIENFMPFVEIIYNAQSDEITKILGESQQENLKLREPLNLDYEILKQYF